MKAFLNDESVRKKYLDRVHAHAKADEFIKGKYWQNGKGCAVGCTIHDSDHSKYETELGIPEWLARVEDAFFEGLPNELAKEWPVKFLEAVNIGADLNKIKPAFMIYILDQALKNFDHEKYPDVKTAINHVQDLWIINPDQTEESLWVAARSITWAVWSAESAVETASWLARSATSVARSATWAVESATWPAWAAARSAESAAESASWLVQSEESAAYVEYSEYLLTLIRECQPPKPTR
jgi:hypothetical protein